MTTRSISMDRRREAEAGGVGGLALVDTVQFEAWLALAEIISKVEDGPNTLEEYDRLTTAS